MFPVDDYRGYSIYRAQDDHGGYYFNAIGNYATLAEAKAAVDAKLGSDHTEPGR